MRYLASAMILLITLATSNLSWPCECEAMQPSEASAAEGHDCCAGSQAEQVLAEIRIQQACPPGCCDGDALVLTALPDDRRPQELKAPLAVPALAHGPHGALVPTHRASFLPARHDIRGPPPSTATRLALLQLWRC